MTKILQGTGSVVTQTMLGGLTIIIYWYSTVADFL